MLSLGPLSMALFRKKHNRKLVCKSGKTCRLFPVHRQNQSLRVLDSYYMVHIVKWNKCRFEKIKQTVKNSSVIPYSHKDHVTLRFALWVFFFSTFLLRWDKLFLGLGPDQYSCLTSCASLLILCRKEYKMSGALGPHLIFFGWCDYSAPTRKRVRGQGLCMAIKHLYLQRRRQPGTLTRFMVRVSSTLSSIFLTAFLHTCFSPCLFLFHRTFFHVSQQFWQPCLFAFVAECYTVGVLRNSVNVLQCIDLVMLSQITRCHYANLSVRLSEMMEVKPRCQVL